MSEFVQYLVNGFAQGSIYALIALGYTMVYGILKLINFAHGEIYMIGGYVGIFLLSTLGLPFWAALLLVMPIVGLFAVLIERFAYRPLRGAPRIAPLITAIGVSIVLLELTRLVAGPQPRPFPQPFEYVSYE
ncbi:MAG: branched-chain amino acid ABC transporter permease, partial [Bdellovibrionota bacterium]